ncbi:Maf-like protein C3G6.03c [Tolypocladium ophioglossoides CBS 100239]|uniref:Maf-like protein C3G6.03c n=1 Tax=Tolypocladium ophioglossoides (strain CBS 100239) TaxID=1163406 RepID=A0A0L0NAQ2_TOLOC|nr:Maf-like protein C3G6.03c [Tolypocladium ophioglossoides CBS 100239]
MADSTTPRDPPPGYTAAAAEHGAGPRPSGPVRRPVLPLDLPILKHLNAKRVILASASPRRKALLQQIGLTNLEIMPSTKPEDLDKGAYVLAPREDARHPGYSITSHTEETKVYFWGEDNGLPDDVIESYVKTREGADKAGGYAVQGIGGMLLVQMIEGSVDNVVGLPVRRCLSMAEKVIFRQDEDEFDEGNSDEEV